MQELNFERLKCSLDLFLSLIKVVSKDGFFNTALASGVTQCAWRASRLPLAWSR